MGLADRLAADAGKFLKTSDFGTTVSYFSNETGETNTITGIFDATFQQAEFSGMEVADTVPAILCASEDVEDGQINDTFTINEVVYYAMRFEPDGAGLTNVILSKSPVHG